MPTVVTVTVKSAGGDYTSLSAAEAGEQADLVAADEQLDIECYAMSDTTNVVWSGWTTDATRYVRVYTPTSERHNGKWDTTAYRLDVTNPSNGHVLRIDINYLRLDGLQISLTAGANSQAILANFLLDNGGTWISNCVIRSVAGGFTNLQGVFLNRSAAVSKMWNNVVYQDGGPSGYGIDNASSNFNHLNYLYNNTVHGFATGITRGSGLSPVAKNNLVQSCTTCYASTYDAASTNNISEDATSPNAAFRNLAVSFVDEANFDFHLAAGDTNAKDAGADLSADANLAFSTDVDGETRSGTWDIGADEFVDAGGGTTIPVLMHNYRRRRV
jgi:hypothetical protein